MAPPTPPEEEPPSGETLVDNSSQIAGIGTARTGTSQTICYWLVVWNINVIFPYIGNNIIPTDSYFSEGVETTNQVSKMYLSILSRIIIRCGCWFGGSSIMSDVAKHGTARLHRPKWKRRRRVGIGLGKGLWEAKSNCVHRSSQNF